MEIKSPSNTEREMQEKKRLYVTQGAQEYWLCDEDGNVSFHSRKGIIEKSGLFPEMPSKIAVDAW
ncbi:MAG: Putative restriction endonuclease [Candidatus Kentron sp. G]|nr:MAG: Putative restriction endonuclease [Candidatus Kentron sp. G]VFM96222.1 MAG: Putative restriction endonuclease [Candidatus Kentron sp. G]VFM98104.1 MAG: Putative restriction endonuclease [Candidatus Kentron sp. G]